MNHNINISGSPLSRTRSSTKNTVVAPVSARGMEMVTIDLVGKLLAIAKDPGVVLQKPTPLCAADYFHMDEGEPHGIGGGSDSDEPVIVPPDSQVVEPNIESPANMGEDNDEGLEDV